MIDFLTTYYLDDPYYCGLRARVPNFAKSNSKTNNSINDRKTSFFSKKDNKPKDKEKEKDTKEKELLPSLGKQQGSLAHPASFSTLYQLHQMQNRTVGTVNKKIQRQNTEPYNMWHAKSYESGIGSFEYLKYFNDYHLR